MVEEIEGPETELFRKLMREAAKWCGGALDAKRTGHRYEALECLRQALEQIGLAFMHV